MSEERWKENAKEHGAMSGDIATMKSDVATMKSDVATMKSNVATMQSDVAKIKEVTSETLSKISVLQSVLIAIAGSIGFSLVLVLVGWAWRLMSGQ